MKLKKKRVVVRYVALEINNKLLYHFIQHKTLLGWRDYTYVNDYGSHVIFECYKNEDRTKLLKDIKSNVYQGSEINFEFSTDHKIKKFI